MEIFSGRSLLVVVFLSATARLSIIVTLWASISPLLVVKNDVNKSWPILIDDNNRYRKE